MGERPHTAVAAAGRKHGARVVVLTGGLLWMAFGAFEFVRPFGSAVTYDVKLEYDVVVDRSLHLLYAGTGGSALLLTSVGLAGLAAGAGDGRRRVRQVSLVCAYAAGAAAMVTLLGVAFGFDPVSTGFRTLGVLLLSAGTAAAAGASAPFDRRQVAFLGVLAAVTLLLIVVYPLVYAVEVLPPAGAVLVYVVVGLAWCLATPLARTRAAQSNSK